MPSVMDYARDQTRQDTNDSSRVSDMPGAKASHEVVTLELKKRHRNNMIKKMLKDAGYTDLASMVKIKSEGV